MVEERATLATTKMMKTNPMSYFTMIPNPTMIPNLTMGLNIIYMSNLTKKSAAMQMAGLMVTTRTKGQ